MSSSPTGTTIAEAISNLAHAGAAGGFTFQDAAGAEQAVTWRELEQRTALLAAGLRARGLGQGDVLGLMLAAPADFVMTFLAAARAGIIPVPLYPPPAVGASADACARTARILATAGARSLLADTGALAALAGLEAACPGLQLLPGLASLPAAAAAPLPAISPDDIAFLQFTSGSVSEPKGVVVTHRTLAANCAGIAQVLEMQAGRDVGVSWLPLYHDMGLVGFVMTPLFTGVSSVLIPTARFLRRPSAWFEALHRHRGTITFCAPFALSLIMRRWSASDGGRWDLSGLRILGLGAEPINAATVRDFLQTVAPHCGLPPHAVTTGYGMAEATLAMSMKRHGDTLTTHRGALEQISCGPAIPGHEICVRGPAGEPLPAGQEGELCFRGPSVSGGYFRDPAATALSFNGGWLSTGDLGYLRDGEVYVTGRIKDLIIINGRNLHPQSLEWTVSRGEGIRTGHVVAFSRPGLATEELVIVLEKTAAKAPEQVVDGVHRRVAAEHGVEVAEVLLLPPGTLPKTSSGKLQRRRARQLYLDGRLGPTPSPTELRS
jgi:fatty-acyl-CoA synthase